MAACRREAGMECIERGGVLRTGIEADYFLSLSSLLSSSLILLAPLNRFFQ
jgi:hypothetical protein